MPTNVYFNHAVKTEQHLYEDLVVESLRFYGHDCLYLPRQIIEEDTIFTEDVQSTFGDAYSVEMYLENTEGFEGEGDLVSCPNTRRGNIHYIIKNMGKIHSIRRKPSCICKT